MFGNLNWHTTAKDKKNWLETILLKLLVAQDFCTGMHIKKNIQIENSCYLL